jgi:hypothetical protein
VLQNQRVRDTGLEMLMTLEKETEPQAAALQVIKPAKVWLEVAPPGEAVSSFVTRWHYQTGYPAPAWGLDVPSWPTAAGGKSPARPVVRAWWAADRLPPPSAAIDRDIDFRNLRGLAGRVLRVDDQEVVLESVTVEDHLVEMEPGVRGQPGQLKRAPCLVVRIAHGRNNPVWVQLRGLEAAGQEHRYYTTAGKYTAIFWPVVRDQAEANLAGLDVFSLTAFKREAEAQRCVVELKNLYEPQTSDLRPPQPLGVPVDSASPPTPEVPLPLPSELPVPKKGEGPQGSGQLQGSTAQQPALQSSPPGQMPRAEFLPPTKE